MKSYKDPIKLQGLPLSDHTQPSGPRHIKAAPPPKTCGSTQT